MKFLSIKQALQKYEVSQTTLTRFARTHQNSKEVKKENRKFFISDSLLASHFQVMDNHLDSLTIQTSNQSEPKKENSKELELITVLKTQNEFLQSQIVEKDSQINKLLQRQSEQNIIIQTLQNNFDGMERKIDSSTNLLSEKVTQKNEVGPNNGMEKGNDNGFTIAASIMIILLVVAIIVFMTVK